MGPDVVKLPSGAEIEMRPVHAQEENVLAKARNASQKRQERALIEVIQMCTTAMVERGPYGTDKVDWNKMLEGDFYGALISLSCISYPHAKEYEFPAKHQACNGAKFTVSINLRKDLIIQPLPEESKKKFQADLPFEVEVAGKKVKYKMPILEDTYRLRKLQERYPDRPVIAGMRSRIVSVDGVDNREVPEWLDGLKDDGAQSKKYDGLYSYQLEEIRDAFDRVSCGVDDEIEVECESCHEDFVVKVPLDRGLLMPSKGIQERRRQRRLGRDT